MVVQIYETRLEIWVAPSAEIWRPKNMKHWHNFGQHQDLNVNITGMQEDIVNQKMVLPVAFNRRQHQRLTHPTGGHHAGLCHAF